MYKLIIIDDDFRSAQAMSEFVDYNSLNFKVEGVFRAAEDALDFLRSNEIHLVLSDIKMKGMSGLEFLKIINQKYPKTKVILISAYRDFSYAKEAISNSAFDYVTKPVSHPEFVDVLKRVHNLLERENNIKISNLEESVGMYAAVSNYFNGHSTLEDIENYFKNSAELLDITKSKCAVLNVKLHNISDFLAKKWKYGSEELFNAIRQIVPTNMNNITLSFLSEAYDNMRIVAIDSGAGIDFKKRIEAVMSYITYEMYSILSLNVNISVKHIAKSICELKDKENEMVSVESTINLIIHALHRDERSDIENILSEFFKINKINEQYVFCSQLAIRLNKIENNNELRTLDDFFLECIDSSEVLRSYCSVLLRQAGVNLMLKDSKINLFFSALYFINDNCFKEISLDTIAEYAALSSSYFSHLFKQRMGISYSDFIIKIRMEKAKKLLADDPNIPIKYLVTAVGYKSQSYFYNAFRDYTGYLPSNFKNKD